MKSRTRTNKASLHRMATCAPLLLVFAVSLITSGFVLSANANERKTAIITFDLPGSGTSAFQGTLDFAISPEGTIAGQYIDSGNASHGYVRARDGTITTFDVPGASQTSALNINPAGAIAGSYSDASYVSHGFVRASDGAITTFDAPGAGTGVGEGTFPYSINPPGAIVGFYLDASFVYHGFLLEGEY